ncbi:hypothetical protein GGR88_000917 [Sphingomonas jejuensis]|uniref:Urease accessory protein n=1 Tax=Sphingomonas jejuensis TaxID=904715 RepID=A0ABX0XJV7_9SPHN|nr:hypothetical protein [Sphingomonas jejuensis]NJC33443.1 hypothetical protein [Sphingomonas jejuensis]
MEVSVAGDTIGHAAAVRIARSAAMDGSVSHPHRAALARSADAPALRARTDFVHHLCALHGRHPGLIDAAAGDLHAPDWMGTAAIAFAGERALLAQIAAAAGPVPGTPGQAASEAALLQQRHVLETLGRSDRAGCTLGAAAALILDWAAMRETLNLVALRFGVDATPSALPPGDLVLAWIGRTDAARARAVTFGAEQLLAQHRGFWSLLEARHHARGGDLTPVAGAA